MTITTSSETRSASQLHYDKYRSMILKSTSNYYHTHREAMREKQRLYYLKNKEYLLERKRTLRLQKIEARKNSEKSADIDPQAEVVILQTQ